MPYCICRAFLSHFKNHNYMSFTSISCQDRIVKLFQNALANNRLAHAYIFAGQDGVGKGLFSRELAKAIFCQTDKTDACNTCRNCQRIDGDNYPDLLTILPEKNSRVIKIEQLKHFQDSLYIKPLESKQKIAIIQSADRMNEEASNCLLKTLEEPPPYALIILIVTSLDAVRETIRSRCQIVRFSPLPASVVQDVLVSKFQQDRNQAQQLASISNGSIGRAMLLSSSDMIAKKNWLVEKVLKLEPEDNLVFSKELLSEWHIQDMEILEEKRSQVRELIVSFLMYYRDLLVCKAGGAETPMYYDSCREALTSRSRSFSEDALFDSIQAIKTALEQLDHNANINLLLEHMITMILHFQASRKRGMVS